MANAHSESFGHARIYTVADVVGANDARVGLARLRTLVGYSNTRALKAESTRRPASSAANSLGFLPRARASIVSAACMKSPAPVIRPRHRVYPAKPKDGIRATKPNEFWHIDVTVIKLLDGTRTYLHAVIDNFSRRILAWRLVLRLEPQTTCQILIEAATNLKDGDGATVIADSGGENVNHEVNDLFGLGQLRRILAQVEVSYSNSMIEALWRSLKHGWLYLHQLDTFAALERLIAFYIEQHNSVVPHSAFAGQTPDEIYFGRGDQVPADLAAGRARAREARMNSNRTLSCEACRPTIRESPGTSDSSAISGVLQMQEQMSAMS